MSTTDLDLYRSIRIEQFPDGVFDGKDPAPGVLYPDFYEKDLGNGNVRPPDVEIRKENGVEYVLAGGGTSLFDRPGVFTKEGWLSFEIPNGTIIPDSLIVKNDGWRKRFKATHYQIESRAGRMTKQAMEGALDNFARNAIVRAVELGRVSLKID
ncbi:hypothetical protein [Methylobacter sp.]|jgi:hypothetical protein|uniref:Tse2 family ADP-ribosyltransferase toxin n=1 Tax=Methylobacter sp. TaxID=2051955 RepID=UPI003DA675D3